jgi:hypothetical protein
MDEKARTRVGGPDDPREGLEAVVALRRTLEALEAAQVENAFIGGMVVGEDRGGVGGEQAGRAQKAREEDPGEVPGPAAGKGGA